MNDDDVDLKSDDVNEKLSEILEESKKDSNDSTQTSAEVNNSTKHTAEFHNEHDDDKIIIIKKVKKVVHGHHGGAWKIAYADFVTAMMAFFLLMWLLSMLNKYQLQGISEYFSKPIHKAADPDEIKDKVYMKDGVATSDVLKVATANKAENEVGKEEKDIDKDKDKDKDQFKLLDEKGEKASGEMQGDAPQESDAIMKEIKEDLKKQAELAEFSNALNFKVISQGLKIEIRDLENQSMFSTGKTDFAQYANQILDWLAKLLNTYPNRVLIVGHTDSHKFINDNIYSNWELSADRATATRRALIQHGMDSDKIARVAGVADTDKLENTNIDDAANRRIAIIVLTDEAYKQLLEQ